jgi:DNA-binding NarL/FixJ family response regulator
MREVMRQRIERQPDMQIVGEELDLSALVRTAEETAADVIIVALEYPEVSELSNRLFAVCPDVTILAVAPRGDSAFTLKSGVGRQEIAAPSEANILTALRSAVQTYNKCTS